MIRMSKCTLKKDKIITWKVDKNDWGDLYDLLYDDQEWAGDIKFGYTTCSKKGCSKTGTIKKPNGGGKDSVKAPDTLVNFHTHPVSCYLAEKTILGWPSGEDMRESVHFGLKGNAAHLVLTMEGTYVIQVNPQILKVLKKMKTNMSRGLAISCMESYFKATHAFRTVSANIALVDGNKDVITPEFFCDFSNKFNFRNLYEKTNSCTASLPCNGVPVHEGKKIFTNNFSKYIDDYGIEVYRVDANGNTVSGPEKRVGIIKKHLKGKKNCFDEVFSSKFTKNRFYESGQWFNVTFFANKFSKNIPVRNNKTYINKMYKFLQDCKDKNNPHTHVSVGEPPSFKFYETEKCKGMKDIKNTLKKSLNKK
tara:strand:+ start:1198 stop:2289 length:1092 start_codon:yes stop_codon:yes gene_type:complete